MHVKTIFHPQYTANWFWGIAVLALWIEFCIHVLLPISISNDSYGYLSLSQHLGHRWAIFERSIGYPLLLSVLGVNVFQNFIPIILVQAAIAVAVPLMIFISLREVRLVFSVLGALLACAYLYNFAVSMYILTEPVFVFAIALFTLCCVRYFQSMSMRHLMYVVFSCFFIAFIRVSGAQYLLSFLMGIGIYVLQHLVKKQYLFVQKGIIHIFIALAVFGSISFLNSLISDRTSTNIWPHFVFNWVYRDAHEAPIYYGIIKSENGPHARDLFQAIQTVITKNPAAFYRLQSGGSETVQRLQPEQNGYYNAAAIQMLMDDIMNNNKHYLRSWWIEEILQQVFGISKTAALMRNAIIEALKKHPDIFLKRMSLVMYGYWTYLHDGIMGNDGNLATACNQRILHVVNAPPPESLRPGTYKQWTYDLYNHMGHDPMNKEFSYLHKFPFYWDGALENIKADNLIGFGHYLVILGMQSIRLCWWMILFGMILFPFLGRKPLLAALCCAAIGPPILSVWVSELDLRHLLMVSPVQIVASIFILNEIIQLCMKITRKWGRRKQ